MINKDYLKLISVIDNSHEEISNQQELGDMSLTSDHEVDGSQQGWLLFHLTLAHK